MKDLRHMTRHGYAMIRLNHMRHTWMFEIRTENVSRNDLKH